LLLTDSPAVLAAFTVRSDNYEGLQEARELDGIPKLPFDLGPIPKGSYADVIRGPMRRLEGTERAFKIDEALVDALLADIETGGAKDALPLLAFTLERLYGEYHAGGHLKLEHYNALGRVQGSIEAAVERAFKAADNNPKIPRDRGARLALLRRGLIPWLAGIDSDTGAPRRRVARLSEIPAEARPLIDQLVEQRLLSTDIAKDTQETTVEPAHEALLRQWGQLQGWLEEDFAALTTLEGVKRAARDWAANSRAEPWLAHSGGRLESAVRIAERDDLGKAIEPTERDYLAACTEREHSIAEENQARLRSRRWWRAIHVGFILCLFCFIFWGINLLLEPNESLEPDHRPRPLFADECASGQVPGFCKPEIVKVVGAAGVTRNWALRSAKERWGELAHVRYGYEYANLANSPCGNHIICFPAVLGFQQCEIGQYACREPLAFLEKTHHRLAEDSYAGTLDTAQKCAEGNSETSITACTTMLRLVNLTSYETSQALYYRGAAHEALDHIERAIVDYTRAIALDQNPVLYRVRAAAFRKTGKIAEAQADDERILELDPKVVEISSEIQKATTDPELYISRGNIYAAARAYNLAITDYTSAIEFNPEDSAPYIARAAAFRKLGKSAEAQADEQQAFEHDPKIRPYTEEINQNDNSFEAYYNRGDGYANVSAYNRAIADFNRAIQINPEYAPAYHRRGDIWLMMNDFDHAITDYTKAIEIEPNNAAYYGDRAWAYFKVDRTSLGLSDVRRSLELDHHNSDAHYTRGRILEAMGRKDEAIANFRQALRIDPTNDESRDALTQLGAALSEDKVKDSDLAAIPQTSADETNNATQSLSEGAVSLLDSAGAPAAIILVGVVILFCLRRKVHIAIEIALAILGALVGTIIADDLDLFQFYIVVVYAAAGALAFASVTRVGGVNLIIGSIGGVVFGLLLDTGIDSTGLVDSVFSAPNDKEPWLYFVCFVLGGLFLVGIRYLTGIAVAIGTAGGVAVILILRIITPQETSFYSYLDDYAWAWIILSGTIGGLIAKSIRHSVMIGWIIPSGAVAQLRHHAVVSISIALMGGALGGYLGCLEGFSVPLIFILALTGALFAVGAYRYIQDGYLINISATLATWRFGEQSR
jgi:tetratricopeptide (TPR) repeat protein